MASETPLSDVRFLTVAEVATIMRVSKMTVWRPRTGNQHAGVWLAGATFACRPGTGNGALGADGGPGRNTAVRQRVR